MEVQAELARRRAERNRGSAELAARESLASFVRQGWHILEPGKQLVWNWHLDFYCSHLEAVHRGEIRRLLVNIPPGTAKSLTLCVFWPAWVWLHRPQWRAVFASYDRSLAIRDSLRCRDLVTSDWYRETFRPPWELRRDQNLKTKFGNTATGWREITSPGSAGTGLRANCVAVDDPHNIKAHPTDAEFQDVAFWWFSRMSNRLDEPERDALIVSGQRSDERDLSGRVLRRGGYTHVCLPSEFNPRRRCTTPIGEDPRTEEGELLFAARFPATVLEEERLNLGPSGYAAQHDQDPTPTGGNLIKEEEVRHHFVRRSEPPRESVYIQGGQVVHLEQRRRPDLDTLDMILASWDFRFGRSQSSSSSWVVGQIWGVQGANVYLLDRHRGRWGFARSKEELLKADGDWPLHGHLIEAKANGEAIEDDLRESVPGLILVNPKGDKIQRLEACSPWFRAGNVYLPHPAECSWVGEVIAELVRFPRYTSDDHVDALTQLINWLRTERHSLSATEALAKA